MKIARDVLARFVDVPDDLRELRLLLDDLGIEVKRSETTPVGPGFTLELLANRGDHHCYAGIAREIHGRTGSALRLPEFATLEVGDGPAVRVETDLCLVYTATRIRRAGPPVSLADDVLAPLLAAGIHSIDAAVDATNLANLELGQPTHVFDADKVKGTVVVRLARPGERAWPLFKQEPVPVPPGAIVIADDEKILAVAGVIGCEDSKATADSKALLLESATFDPVAVRKAARAMGIATDSSARFERGADPTAPLVGAGRVVHVLSAVGWTVAGPTTVVETPRAAPALIDLDLDWLSRFLEVEFTGATVVERLERVGFEVAGASSPGHLRVTVPPHRRWDVEHVQDLAEEIAKSVGYNATPMSLPPVGRGALPTREQLVRAAVSDVFVAHGFFEVITDGFYGRGMRDLLGVGDGHALHAHVETRNAVDRDYSLLKNNALAQALAAVATNLRNRVGEVKAFEWTRTFHPDPSAQNGLCHERRLVWGIANGHERAPTWSHAERPADALFVKGMVAQIAAALHLALRFGPVPSDHPLGDMLHPHRCLAVFLGEELVGVLGEVHPAVVQRFKIKRARPVYLELSLDPLCTEGTRARWSEPPDVQPMERSLAFDLPPGVEAQAVVQALRGAGVAELAQVAVTDLFVHDEAGVTMRAVTFALTFSGGEQSADQVNATLSELVGAVAASLGARGVVQRA